MPSPVGHSLAGLCGYMVAKNHVAPARHGWLLVSAVVIALLPDLDFLPGLLLGDLPSFHHQATHSIVAAVVFTLLVIRLVRRYKLKETLWGIWAGALYLSHIVLDLLANDSSPPLGVQLLWPFSESYFISPATPFPNFDYFDPARGILSPLLSFHNLTTMLTEVVLMAPLVGLAWYLGKNWAGHYVER